MSKVIFTLTNANGERCDYGVLDESDLAAARAAGTPPPLWIIRCPDAASKRLTVVTSSTAAEVRAARAPGVAGVQLGAQPCKVISTDPDRLVCEVPERPPTRTCPTATPTEASEAARTPGCATFPRTFYTITFDPPEDG